MAINTVAVLSDIHGALPALEAVLADPAIQTADRIVLTGDIVTGPMPAPTLERLNQLGDRVVWVRGNADREVSRPDAEPGLGTWVATQLTPQQITFLAGLPTTVTLDLTGFGPVLFCHATPRNDNEFVVVDSRLDRWTEVMADRPEATVVCGHTHMPFLRLAHRRLIVNPGSVGMPYGGSGAYWALLDRGAVTFRRTEYDSRAAADRIIAESSYPEAADWVEHYLLTTASDTEALAVFGPLDGRDGPVDEGRNAC